MQTAGTEFTTTSAMFGNDIATFPDFPAEIRAPAGTVPGVSGFQVNFSADDIHHPGDEVDALIAMNPAAFKAHINDVRVGGIVVVNDSEFTKINLRKAHYSSDYNPLDDEKYQQKYKIYRVPISRLNEETLAESTMGAKSKGRCKNFFALGLIYWLYDRPLETTTKSLDDYFGKKKNMPEVAEANIKAMKAGYFFGETTEMFPVRYEVPRAQVQPGLYRKITGNEAAAMGLIAGANLAGKNLIYCTYPITPASDILHNLAPQRHFGVKTFQAEDEIAAVAAAIGASFAGQLGATGTSGPGLALKSEAVGLAVMTELPLVIVNVQRGGPSTGLPTKTEQSDLLQAMYGRNGDCPCVIVAPQSPADCFEMAIEACAIAMQHMMPVIILTDGFIANGAEPWRIPDPGNYDRIEINHPTDPETYEAYGRDENHVRPWVMPGMAGFEHRIGGLEKENISGNVSYDPGNHQLMTDLRQAKVDKIADRIPAIEPYGSASGELLVLGWGGTYGQIITAVERCRNAGLDVSAVHLRHLNPFPRNIHEVLKRYKNVLIPELNMGQLRMLIRGKFLVNARGLNKVQGKPFQVEEIEQAIRLMLDGKWGDRESISPHDHKVE